MSTATFNPAKCHFPEKGKSGDLSNGDFRLYAEVEIEKPETLYFIVKWEGAYFLLHEASLSCDGYPCNGPVEVTWTEPPTIAEFLEMVGEPIPEKQTEYSYAWVLGYKTGEEEFELMNTMDAGLTVEEPEPELPKTLLLGCGIAVVGLYGAGVIVSKSKKSSYLALATPLKLTAMVPAGVGAWKGGEWVYQYVKEKI